MSSISLKVRLLFGALLASFVSLASAAPIDLTAVTTALTDGEGSLNTVGTAILSLVVIIAIFAMIFAMLRRSG